MKIITKIQYTMKTTKNAASDYAEITNLLTGIEEYEIERAFLKGAEFADRWIHINEKKPEWYESVLTKFEDGEILICWRAWDDEKECDIYTIIGTDKITESNHTYWKTIK
jgi:hypothetical protein